MTKRLLRIVSLAMAILLGLSWIPPMPTNATAATTPNEIERQIIRTFNDVKEYYGRNSFDGYCGKFVNGQLYMLGITSRVVGNNGNDEFDEYCNQKITSGGFKVKAYPAKDYTMLEALNAITNNGTKNAYNILVGIEKTKSTMGSRYGHACMIHAIIGGKVYYMESYDLKINGRFYPEGTPIVCTIEEFVKYYSYSMREFDGIILFGLKNYADQCRTYPANLEVTASVGAAIRTEPCDSKLDSRSKQIRSLKTEEQLHVTGLYLNTAGEYWYQIGEQGYIRASQTQVSQLLFDDVTVKSPEAPAILRQGKAFNIKGTVQSVYNQISTLRAQVFRMEADGQTQAISTTDSVDGNSYKLSSSSISKGLTFRKLSVGNYRYDLAAIVGNYYVDAGRLQVQWQTVDLWSSDFQVLEESTGYNVLTLDPNGGSVAVQQTPVTVGDGAEELPVAQRPGHVFLGWFSQAEGGERVDANYVPTEDMKIYAHWISEEELFAAWQERGQCQFYHSDGLTTMGSFVLDGVLYYFSSVDSAGQSWIMWTAAGAA